MGGYVPFAPLIGVSRIGPPPMPVVDIEFVRPSRGERIVVGRKRFFVTTTMVAEMKRLRQQNVTLHQIARMVGVSHYTVRKHTLDVLPPSGGWNKGGSRRRLDKTKAERMRRAGFTFREIGQEIGCSESGAHNLLNDKRTHRRGPIPRVTQYVQVVARVTGHSCKSLRASLRGPRKKGSKSLSKARAMLFWLAHKALAPIAATRIGVALGGFEGTTISDGVKRTEAAIANLQFCVPRHLGRIVAKLWQAEWSGDAARVR